MEESANTATDDSNRDAVELPDAPLRRSKRGKGRATNPNHAALGDDCIQSCVVGGVEYRVGDFIYFEETDFEYFTIGLIENIKLSRREKCSLVVKCFWRTQDVPECAKHSLYDREEQQQRIENLQPSQRPSEEALSRELFVSDLQSTVFANHLRGLCKVIHLSDLANATELLRSPPNSPGAPNLPEDTFFYVFAYNPETRRLTSTIAEIKVGKAHQVTLPAMRHSPDHLTKTATRDEVIFMREALRKARLGHEHCEHCPYKYHPGEHLSWETLQWRPDACRFSDDALKTYLEAARSLVAFLGFGGARDDLSSAENGLVLGNLAATTQLCYDVLHAADYSIPEALELIKMNPLPPGGDTPREWTADQVHLFKHACTIKGKDFHAIQREFFNGTYSITLKRQIPPSKNASSNGASQEPPEPVNADLTSSMRTTRNSKMLIGKRKRATSPSDDSQKPVSELNGDTQNEAPIHETFGQEVEKLTTKNDRKEDEAGEASASNSASERNPGESSKLITTTTSVYKGPVKSVKQLIAFYYYWKHKGKQANMRVDGLLAGAEEAAAVAAEAGCDLVAPVPWLNSVFGAKQNRPISSNTTVVQVPSPAPPISSNGAPSNGLPHLLSTPNLEKTLTAGIDSAVDSGDKVSSVGPGRRKKTSAPVAKTVANSQRQGWSTIHETRRQIRQELAETLRRRSGLSPNRLDLEDRGLWPRERSTTPQPATPTEESRPASASGDVPLDLDEKRKKRKKKKKKRTHENFDEDSDSQARSHKAFDEVLDDVRSTKSSVESQPETVEPAVQNGNLDSKLESKEDSSEATNMRTGMLLSNCRNCGRLLVTGTAVPANQSGPEAPPPQSQLVGQLRFLCLECRTHLQKYGKLKLVLNGDSTIPSDPEKTNNSEKNKELPVETNKRESAEVSEAASPRGQEANKETGLRKLRCGCLERHGLCCTHWRWLKHRKNFHRQQKRKRDQMAMKYQQKSRRVSAEVKRKTSHGSKRGRRKHISGERHSSPDFEDDFAFDEYHDENLDDASDLEEDSLFSPSQSPRLVATTSFPPPHFDECCCCSIRTSTSPCRRPCPATPEPPALERANSDASTVPTTPIFHTVSMSGGQQLEGESAGTTKSASPNPSEATEVSVPLEPYYILPDQFGDPEGRYNSDGELIIYEEEEEESSTFDMSWTAVPVKKQEPEIVETAPQINGKEEHKTADCYDFVPSPDDSQTTPRKLSLQQPVHCAVSIGGTKRNFMADRLQDPRKRRKRGLFSPNGTPLLEERNDATEIKPCAGPKFKAEAQEEWKPQIKLDSEPQDMVKVDSDPEDSLDEITAILQAQQEAIPVRINDNFTILELTCQM
ncbi:hypothetical protein Ciccas_004295 [Cichlidogyrus casuarinus]|uniref:BAH domain-containing protein n=1 Tax=Cichlidogyrus casuarinus TaxID=1844966 RepID=A0ABD2QBZ0_9PLAT